MERLLHYVWKYKLYLPTALTLTDGRPLRILDPGSADPSGAPFFRNARIQIGETLLAGSVEIVGNAASAPLSGWGYVAKQDGAPRAILRVRSCPEEIPFSSLLRAAEDTPPPEPGQTPGDEPVPEAELPVPGGLSRTIAWLLESTEPIACRERIKEVGPLHLSLWLGALVGERLKRKTDEIAALLRTYGNDWNEVFYIIFTRYFGFGSLNVAFEALARSLPLRCIRKQRGSQTQVEALLLGQAGLLEDPIDNAYYRLLQREYRFLCHKFDLRQPHPTLAECLRNRPYAFPHLKLAQLAAVWQTHDTLFSAILEAGTLGEIKKFFHVLPSAYWETHYHFRAASAPKRKPLGETALHILLINTVVPMLFAYGRHTKLPEYTERAVRLLENLPPEKNSIVTAFGRAGVPVQHAADSQALIQLKREYCEHKRCLDCRIGFQLLKISLSRIQV